MNYRSLRIIRKGVAELVVCFPFRPSILLNDSLYENERPRYEYPGKKGPEPTAVAACGNKGQIAGLSTREESKKTKRLQERGEEHG